MVSRGLLIRLEARPGHEAEVAEFLNSIIPVVQKEPGTTALFGVQLGERSFGIFNAFPNDEARQQHIGGDAARLLSEMAAASLAAPPGIEAVDILGAKLPG
jgi:quinol monooxygenase YgiN